MSDEEIHIEKRIDYSEECEDGQHDLSTLTAEENGHSWKLCLRCGAKVYLEPDKPRKPTAI